jgi:hypothetical protein
MCMLTLLSCLKGRSCPVLPDIWYSVLIACPDICPLSLDKLAISIINALLLSQAPANLGSVAAPQTSTVHLTSSARLAPVSL